MMHRSSFNSVQNPSEGVWLLFSSSKKLIGQFKTKNELLEVSHELELKKARRIKRLEAYCSMRKNMSLYGVS